MNEEHSDIEDQLLVMGAQDGDPAAMDQLIGRWQKRLWQHAFRLTADHQGAWDITQNTWLGIIKGLRRLHDPADFKAWAYKITTNQSINWMKRRKSGKERPLAQVEQLEQRKSSDMGVEELLQKLDVKKREVLCLYYFEQLSVSEISVALSIPGGTVKSRLHNARRELKELWKKYSG